MKKPIKANQIKKGMIIVDQLDEEIVVDEVWPDQGDGLGIVVKGKRVSDVGPSHNRYYNIDQTVTQIDREDK